jgi:hypothetical protein
VISNQQLCIELLSVIKFHRETEPTLIRYNILLKVNGVLKTENTDFLLLCYSPSCLSTTWNISSFAFAFGQEC